LRNERDIREAGINPFRHFVLHGRREGRRGANRIPTPDGQVTLPSVSIIVPNYNHASYLPERLRSIVAQDYPNLELIILDDCSQDSSPDLIRDFASGYQGNCRVVFNDVNSGSVFSQWQKGLSLASGELIWICESDDTCEPDFLKKVVYLFQDPSIRIAFGNIQFIDEHGNIIQGMDGLRESAAAGIWNEINIMPAAKWFAGPLGIRNLISNVGGAIFRQPYLNAAAWDAARTFRVAGDWFLYVLIAGGGRIAYVPGAKAYFRQHKSNTSVIAFDRTFFYEELSRFHIFLRERWEIPLETTFKFYATLVDTFSRSELRAEIEIGQVVSLDQLIKVERKSIHIAVSFLNFNVGGGEMFPIEVLNRLRELGFMVSAVVQTDASDNDFVRGLLHPDIPIYSADWSSQSGPQLARDAAFDIIHSHNIWSEFYFLSSAEARRFKYVVTLHGSYEVSQIRREQLARFFDEVTWAYTADRNLEKFKGFGFDTAGFQFITNGMGRKISGSPVRRSHLGISDDAIVFLFAARSHPDKGWREAASAFDQLTQGTDVDAWLIMAGDGPEAQAIKQDFAHNSRIQLLGFRSDVDDLLALSDFAVLPTRFAGESMPFIVIQSILASVPMIATDVGQIRTMIGAGTASVGCIIEASSDDDALIESLLAKMKEATDGKLTFAPESFEAAAIRYSVPRCVDKYLRLYGVKLTRAGARHLGSLGSATSRVVSRATTAVTKTKPRRSRGASDKRRGSDRTSAARHREAET
jgi:glycosyltransferase involved in cell wall biosynthesis/GT2 family glycosyltransferase